MTDGRRLAAHERRLRLLLHHLAGRAIRQRVEIEDLVQEVYVRALTAPGGLPPAPEPSESVASDTAPTPGDEALFRFLARVARNVVVDLARAIRAAKRDGAVVQLDRSSWSRTDLGAQIAADAVGPHTEVSQREAHDTLAAAFDALAPDHRRVLGLRQFEGRSARETAAQMRRGEAAIHSLYRRALVAWELEARQRGVSETAFG